MRTEKVIQRKITAIGGQLMELIARIIDSKAETHGVSN